LITGRVESHVPRSKRLLTDDRSNVLVFLSGHGGNDFLKFSDTEELSSQDLADAFGQMHEKNRYNEILFIVDTCEASTLYSKFYSPNILSIGSSVKEQPSFSHHSDKQIVFYIFI
jgi:phosphatidylinositol glycan class K